MKKNLGFVLVTVMLFLIAICSMGSVALGRGKDDRREERRYYAGLETTYMQQVRGVLDDAGLTRAGVMLTYVREADGTRYYTLSVHHPDYARLEVSQQELLADSLAACAFSREGCFFEQRFE